MKKTLLFIALLITATSQAQTYTLAYFKGTIEVSNSSGWDILKNIGATVNKSQSVRVNDKAEAIFTGPKGETVYLKKTGTFKVSEFVDNVSSDQKSLSNYYLSTIAHQVTHKDADDSKGYDKQVKNLGGVSRASGYHCLKGPVNATYVIDSNIRMVWSNFHRDNYTVTIYDDIDHKAIKAKQTVKDTFAVINRFEQKFEAGKTYYWTVTSANTRPCEIYSFSVMGKEEQNKVTMELNKLKLQLDVTGGLRNAILGKFYESKGFYENARNNYEDACAAEPESEVFKNLLTDFDSGSLPK